MTGSAGRRQGLTTRELIERLRQIDPTGDRTVFVEISRDREIRGHLDTDALKGVYAEDGSATWDADRLKVVLTNEEVPADAR